MGWQNARKIARAPMTLPEFSPTALAEPPSAGCSGLVCGHRDSLYLAISRCLDGGAGLCFVVDDEKRIVGRVTLDSVRNAIRKGELSSGTPIGRSVALMPEPVNSREDFAGVATPMLDARGRLVDVIVDQGRAAVPLSKPDMTSAELEALLDAFVSTWISSRGPQIGALETGFSDLVGTREAIAVSSGTAALHLALLSLGIGPGDEVVVPDLTFAATINAVIHSGATPVIADIDPASWGLCPDALADAITARTKAVILVHLYGRPVLSDTFRCAWKHGLAIVEDCAEAQGAEVGGSPVGSIGEVGCFSLFANKLISTGEGGMCTTQRVSLAANIRELRDHGMDASRPFWHERVGYNYRMTNLQAAIGTVQLKRFGEIVTKRNRVAALYRKHLADIPGIHFPSPPESGSRAVNWLATVLVPPEKRAELIEAALAERIELRGFFHPLSAMPPYRAYARDCPNSARIAQSGLCLPTSGNEDDHVAEKIARIFQEVIGSS